jgi:hypothetical protein
LDEDILQYLHEAFQQWSNLGYNDERTRAQALFSHLQGRAQRVVQNAGGWEKLSYEEMSRVLIGEFNSEQSAVEYLTQKLACLHYRDFRDVAEFGFQVQKVLEVADALQQVAGQDPAGLHQMSIKTFIEQLPTDTILKCKRRGQQSSKSS